MGSREGGVISFLHTPSRAHTKEIYMRFAVLVVGNDPQEALEKFRNLEFDGKILGGRWKNFFQLKEGAKLVPSAFRRDIDFEAMIQQVSREERAFYDRAMRMFGGTVPVDDGERATEVSRLAASVHLIPDDLALLLRSGDFTLHLEAYIDRMCHEFFSTHAVVKDGYWFEKSSEECWWNNAGGEVDQPEWDRRVFDLIRDTPEDVLLTVFDCHF